MVVSPSHECPVMVFLKIFTKHVDDPRLFHYHVDMIKRINMIGNGPLEGVIEILNALSDRTRQEIVMLFYSLPEACVTDIVKHFKLSRPTISHHLNLMKRAKILNSRKEGKEIYYSFNKQYVVGMLNSLVKMLNGCC